MGTKKFDVRVWCMAASYNFVEYAQDKNIAIEMVRGRVMSDMKNWNFSASLSDDNGDYNNDDDN